MKINILVIFILVLAFLVNYASAADTSLSVDISYGKMTLFISCSYGNEKCERVLYCLDQDNKCTPSILTNAEKVVENPGKAFVRYMGVGSDEERGSVEFAEVTGNFYIVAKNSRQKPLPQPIILPASTSTAGTASTTPDISLSVPKVIKKIEIKPTIVNKVIATSSLPAVAKNTKQDLLSKKLKSILVEKSKQPQPIQLVKNVINREGEIRHIMSVLLAYKLMNR